MSNVSRRHAWLLPGLLAALLFATACFQPSGAPDLPATQVPGGVLPAAPTTQAPGAIEPADLTRTPSPTPEAEGLTADATPNATATAQQELYLTATQIVADFAATEAARSGTEIIPTLTPTSEAGLAEEQPTPLTAETPPADQALQQPAAEECIHIVQRGENLFRIAQRYGLTVEQMATANNIADPNRIYVGQRLVVPNCQGGGQPVTQPAPQPGGRTHVVQRGETLFSIARRYGVTVEQIVTANNIANPSRIYVGQVLVIP